MQSAVPLFPEFRALRVSDRGVLDHYTRGLAPSSDLCFMSLWAWNVDGTCSLAALHDNLVIRLTDYADGVPFFTLLGANRIAETTGDVFTYLQTGGHTAVLRLIPEHAIAHLASRVFVTEDRDNHDYILSVNDYEARINRRRRHDVGRFVKLYGAAQTGPVDLNHEKDAVLTLASQQRNDREYAALARLLAHPDHRCLATGLRVKDALAAYAIYELLDEEYAVCHFAHADKDVHHAGRMVERAVIRELREHNIRYYNLEQDLGLPGLRQAKLQQGPVTFLKKYTVQQ